MRNAGFFWFILGTMVLLDIYTFQAIQIVLPPQGRVRLAIIIGYWVVSVIAFLFILLVPMTNYTLWPKWIRTYVFAIIVGLFFAKLLASVFFAIDDIRRGGTWLISKLFQYQPADQPAVASTHISRSAFLSWMGITLGGGLFGTLLVGFSNKYRYQVKKLKLKYPNLPAAFKGLRIVHISDIHSGSFMDKKAVAHGVEMILKQKPDLILFTGDLVNDRASEMDDYMDVFNQLKAPLGVYSTLGNHDYGDYVVWESQQAKINNLERLKQVHKELGWRLLMNEHVTLQKDNDQIALLGIENWSGKGNFGGIHRMSPCNPNTSP